MKVKVRLKKSFKSEFKFFMFFSIFSHLSYLRSRLNELCVKIWKRPLFLKICEPFSSSILAFLLHFTPFYFNLFSHSCLLLFELRITYIAKKELKILCFLCCVLNCVFSLFSFSYPKTRFFFFTFRTLFPFVFVIIFVSVFFCYLLFFSCLSFVGFQTQTHKQKHTNLNWKAKKHSSRCQFLL